MELEIDENLVQIIQAATENALNKLFSEHNENYYYVSLITIGECECPFISAWSSEALHREASKKEDYDKEKYYLKWSYADSPYCAYGYDEFFSEVREAYNKRTGILDDDNDEEYEKEMSIRLNSMEKAMHNLDLKGMFGNGEKRIGIVINAEYMPPDPTNTERALRLNPKEALAEWLKEAAETI